MKLKIFFSIAAAALLAGVACRKPATEPVAENYSAGPSLPASPYNYSVSVNDHRATLGRVLFYDKNLSQNNSVACGSCHQQSKAFCDNLAASPGLQNKFTSRNTPSIFAKSGRMFWDGRASGMQDLVLKPVTNHVEMGVYDLGTLAGKLQGLPYYPALFKKAFGSEEVTVNGIQTALNDFLLNFSFSDNKFNRSETNRGPALNALEHLGKEVFFDKGRCDNCHHVNAFSGYGFTDMDFNIGLDKDYLDNGVASVAGASSNSSRNGSFMVPVLLNVEHTAPYMHDGRFKTLEEVVEHYNSGIQPHPNLSWILSEDFDLIANTDFNELLKRFDTNHDGQLDDSEITSNKPARLNLTDMEKKGLVAFLKTLSDPSIFTDVKFSDPFRTPN